MQEHKIYLLFFTDIILGVNWGKGTVIVKVTTYFVSNVGKYKHINWICKLQAELSV